MSRQIVLDTETTGLSPTDGHRVIEIGCVELRERRLTGHNLHLYLQPDREIDAGALEVHGISNEFLADKPRFDEVVGEFLDYLRGAELIIHNAPFDVGFLEHELRLCQHPADLAQVCSVTDSLAMARRLYPGQRNSLDALCKRLGVSNAHRTLHGALLDSELLADVYLRMTGGQTALHLDAEQDLPGIATTTLSIDTHDLPVIDASQAELALHEKWLSRLDEASEQGARWRACDASGEAVDA